MTPPPDATPVSPLDHARRQLEAGRIEEAGWAVGKLARREPDNPEVIALQAALERATGRAPQALSRLEEGLRRFPKCAALWFEMASSRAAARDGPAKVAALREVLKLEPLHRRALQAFTWSLALEGRWAELDPFRETLVEVFADDAGMLALVANMDLAAGDLDGAAGLYERAIRVDPSKLVSHSNCALVSLYRPGLSADQVFEAHRQSAGAFGAVPSPRAVRPVIGRRLRVGYLSADFRQHSVTTFFELALRAHDRASVEAFCYSTSSTFDAVSARLAGTSEHWRHMPVASVTTAQAREMIQQDDLDVLVELSGHTSAETLAIVARRVAPIQVSWLGYPNTTGLPDIDYRITDAIAGPGPDQQRLYSEKLVALPGPFYAYAGPEGLFEGTAPEVGRPPPFDAVRFGLPVNISKVTREMIASYCRIMRRLPGSTVEILAFSAGRLRAQSWISEAFEAGGIGRDRVTFTPGTNFREYLESHRRWHAILETFPATGHTTTCHALFMGVPVVTLAGDSYISRLGASVLHYVGLPELIAASPEGYEEAVVELVGDRERLVGLRETLRSRMRSSPVMDGAALARGLEGAFHRFASGGCGPT